MRSLASGGVDAVRVEGIARTLGVTKGGFYGYFTDRQALLDEILDAWERILLFEPMTKIDAEPGDGRARLGRLFDLAAGSSRDMLAVELAVRVWARQDRAVAARVSAIDDRRTAYMRALFAEFCDDKDDIEGRCLLASTLFIGNHFVATNHPNRARVNVVQSALAHLLQ
ncbi:TetR/AcrR family transcriptional regulator [Aeromicrobium sp.]|uniref:TetR/AcrR family transcriptional regulator n=1 Tax=Aeromicrobium sp. TaxID=1871063 RepID=UPI003C5F5180